MSIKTDLLVLYRQFMWVSFPQERHNKLATYPGHVGGEKVHAHFLSGYEARHRSTHSRNVYIIHALLKQGINPFYPISQWHCVIH